MLSTIATTATAQGPWTVEIKPSTTPLVTGGCTPIRLTLLDASGKDAPRNPTGMRVSISDFDMTVAPAGAVVGRYDGAASWSACACPAVERISRCERSCELRRESRARIWWTSTCPERELFLGDVAECGGEEGGRAVKTAARVCSRVAPRNYLRQSS
jgi:hypothetical protein